MATATATSGMGGAGGQGGGGPPKKLPDDKPVEEDDGNTSGEGDREFCDVCNKYLRVGQTLKKHRKKTCVGPRDLWGDFPCRFPGCAARYRHYYDLQNHWRKHHPGARQTREMVDYIP